MRGSLDWRKNEGDGSRGSGRTHRQIESLRDGDVFVVGDQGSLSFAKHLADRIGRKLRIVTSGRLMYDVRGLDPNVWIEVDHACALPPGVFREIMEHNSRRHPG